MIDRLRVIEVIQMMKAIGVTNFNLTISYVNYKLSYARRIIYTHTGKQANYTGPVISNW